jgi:hypothetical protein
MKIELRGTDGQSRQFERVVLPLPRDLIERPVVYAFVRLNESGDFRVISIDEALTPGRGSWKGGGRPNQRRELRDMVSRRRFVGAPRHGRKFPQGI